MKAPAPPVHLACCGMPLGFVPRSDTAITLRVCIYCLCWRLAAAGVGFLPVVPPTASSACYLPYLPQPSIEFFRCALPTATKSRCRLSMVQPCPIPPAISIKAPLVKPNAVWHGPPGAHFTSSHHALDRLVPYLPPVAQSMRYIPTTRVNYGYFHLYTNGRSSRSVSANCGASTLSYAADAYKQEYPPTNLHNPPDVLPPLSWSVLFTVFSITASGHPSGQQTVLTACTCASTILNIITRNFVRRRSGESRAAVSESLVPHRTRVSDSVQTCGFLYDHDSDFARTGREV